MIHTVGPIYDDGNSGEPELLADCHHNSVALAAEHGLQSLAFPAISTGVFGYPLADAARVAIAALDESLARHAGVELVRMVLFGDELFRIYSDELTERRK